VLISVIIPTRNRPDFVLEAVASVLRQSHGNFELIIVNDGTTAVTPSPDSRVRVLDSNQRGAVPARNLGIAEAQGDAIAWLDDDDVWTDTDFLKSATACLNGTADFVFGDGNMVYPDGKSSRSFARDADAVTLAKDNTILISAVCYRKSLHQKLGLFDETLPYYWDWDWYLRVARAGYNLQRIATPTVNIRIHENNMSGLANTTARTENLNDFAQKHRLGKLALKSHVDFAQ
jgi:glycosyltransferase involved in cell wall biosynthesis